MTESASHFDQAAAASQPAGVETTQAGLPNQPRCIRSEEILQGENEVLILHGGAVYRLRHTKSGKLILNK
jgi:hemin uptake protein HemP